MMVMRSTSPRRPAPWCSPWLAGPTFRREANGSKPSGPNTSNGSPPGRSWRPSPSKPGSIPTPELTAPGGLPLRVGLDARALTDDATGVGRYIRSLIAALQESHGVELMPYRDGGPRFLGPQMPLPLRMRREGAQLIHGPANALPLLPVGLPGVVTIHDLAIYDHPEWFPTGQWFATRVVVPQSIRHATAIICPSLATRKAIIRLFGVAAERCRVIPHGVEPDFALAATQRFRDAVKTKYGLPRRYLL